MILFVTQVTGDVSSEAWTDDKISALCQALDDEIAAALTVVGNRFGITLSKED